MLTNPKRIKFETTDDIVDYVSKGLPPKKKNYNQIIFRLDSPITAEDLKNNRSIVGNETVITEDVVSTWVTQDDTDELTDIIDILNRVYANKRKDTIKSIIIGAVVAVGAFVAGGAVAKHSSKNDTCVCDCDCDDCVDDWDADTDSNVEQF